MAIPALPPRMDRETVINAMQGQRFPEVDGEFKEHVLGYRFNPERTENGKRLSANIEMTIKVVEAPHQRYIGRRHSIKQFIGGKFPEYEQRARWAMAAAVLGADPEDPEFDGNQAEQDLIEADAKGELEAANRFIYHTRVVKIVQEAEVKNGQPVLVEKKRPRDTFSPAE